MSSTYLRPLNRSAERVRWDALPREIEREIMLKQHGSQVFEASMHLSVLRWLSDGFAVPNGSIGWSILFSDLSDEQYRDLDEMCPLTHEIGWRPWSQLGDGDSFDLRRRLLFEWAVTRRRLGRDGTVGRYCESLPIIDVGLSISREYTCLSWACEELITQQVGKPTDLVAMSNPNLLKLHMHDYINQLVFLNNEVQRFHDLTERAACDWDVDRAHNEKLSDKEIARIAASAPAVVFTQALTCTTDRPRFTTPNQSSFAV